MGTRENRLAEAVLTSTHNLCLEKKYEKCRIFYWKIFLFLVVKFSIYLNRLVFVMNTNCIYPTLLSTFQKVVYCLVLYTEEVKFAIFCHDLMQNRL